MLARTNHNLARTLKIMYCRHGLGSYKLAICMKKCFYHSLCSQVNQCQALKFDFISMSAQTARGKEVKEDVLMCILTKDQSLLSLCSVINCTCDM